MQIKILGSGCKKCLTLAENTRLALEQQGLQADIDKVTDYAQIAAYGVMSTPALVIDGKLVAAGRVLSSAEIAPLLPRVPNPLPPLAAD
ncbi:MAG: thioredoxin family protein [Gammaproteobacteria bacterium]